MEALIVLATIMALFGVVGYQRGTKSSLVTALVIWLGLVLITQASRPVARIVNGLNFGVRFILAGGLSALGGDGDRGAALDKVMQNMPKVTPLINPDGTGSGILILFLLLVILAFLLGMLKLFKSKASVWGLVIGLANGYVLSAFLLPRLLPDAALRLPLPAGLAGAGSTAASGSGVGPAGPSLSAALAARLVAGLNTLVEGGQIALVIAVLIALFVLLATRLGNRKK